MQAIRLALLPIERSSLESLPLDYKELRICLDNVEVGFGADVLQISDQSVVVLVAQTHLKRRPKLTKDGFVVVPQATWRALEDSLERIARIFAVASGKPTFLTSPEPCVALRCADESDWDFLKNATSIKTSGPKLELGLAAFEVNIWSYLPSVGEREDGIALLVDGLRQSRAGKFRESWRLFERAFRKSGKGLIEPLSNFLRSNDMDYTTGEVTKWLS